MADKWTVISQRQTVALDAAGNFDQVVEVTFQTAAGHVGRVNVPVRIYGVDTAREAIDAYADKLDAVAQL